MRKKQNEMWFSYLENVVRDKAHPMCKRDKSTQPLKLAAGHSISYQVALHKELYRRLAVSPFIFPILFESALLVAVGIFFYYLEVDNWILTCLYSWKGKQSCTLFKKKIATILPLFYCFLFYFIVFIYQYKN